MIPYLRPNRFLFFGSTLGLTALLTSACVPIPHFEQIAPAIEGQIFRNGNPAENVEIKLVDFDSIDNLVNDGCNNAAFEETYTDSEGMFSVEETTEFELVMLAADSWENWALCFTFSDGARAIWSDGSVGGGPNVQYLTCKFGEELKINQVLHIDNLNNREPNGENPITSYLCQVVDE